LSRSPARRRQAIRRGSGKTLALIAPRTDLCSGVCRETQAHGAVRYTRALAEQPVIVGVGANPEPYPPIRGVYGKGAIATADLADQKRPIFLKCSDG
jgi:hypothetical protein